MRNTAAVGGRFRAAPSGTSIWSDPPRFLAGDMACLVIAFLRCGVLIGTGYRAT